MATLPTPAKKEKAAAAQKNAEVQLNPPDAYLSVLAHFPVYRNAYRSLLKFSLLLGILQGACVLFILFIVVSAKPEDRFFTSSVTGHNVQVYPADTAFDEQTINQVVRGVIDAMNFGYLSYAARFAETKDPFTPENFQKLIGTIMGAGGIEGMVANEISYDAAFDESRPFQVIHSGVGADLVFEATYDIPVIVTTKRGMETAPRRAFPSVFFSVNWKVSVGASFLVSS